MHHNLKLSAVLVAILLLSACSQQMTRDEQEYCIWRTALVGTVAGSFGGVGGAAAGAAGGAAVGTFLCGPVGPDEEPKKMMAKEAEGPLDSDGDGVPDFRDWCAGTDANVSVDDRGCALDSDNDGVPDYLDQCPGTPEGVAVDDAGCPLSGATLLVLENINFDFDSDVISSDSDAILEQAVRVLRQNGRVSVDVVGHTDSRGGDNYNQKLSERRANAVRDYLIGQGIDSSRLYASGEGESSPVSSNDTNEGRRKNRRVEFVVR